MEDMETIILNSVNEQPKYYLVTEDDTDYNVGIIQANLDEDCVAKIEKMILAVTNADKLIDIELNDADEEESFATYEITYLKDGETEIRNYSFVVVELFN